jgi:hypothetical protein
LQSNKEMPSQKFDQRQTLIKTKEEDLEEEKPQYFNSNDDFYDVYNNPES